MAPNARAGGPRLEIRSDRLLLVEGKDEANLFNALMIQQRIGAEAGVRIIDAGAAGRDGGEASGSSGYAPAGERYPGRGEIRTETHGIDAAIFWATRSKGGRHVNTFEIGEMFGPCSEVGWCGD